MDKYQVLKRVFGYDTFREGQEKIVDGILAGRDVLGIMPTGAGKSICYQLPALMMEGITLVVSPLISLMIDQVKALNEAGIHAAYINSALSEGQITKALYNAMRGQYKIIYVAPERLETNRFLEFVMNANISMITVDEAHCISQWGQDFRPSYLKIVNLINRLPQRPVVSAFTATATSQVKDDIECVLGLNNPLILVTGFDRSNLYFEVRHTKYKDDEILAYVGEHRNESGIIYCATRKNVDKIYLLLKKHGYAAARYHAGMDNDERQINQDDFIYDRANVIVATNAFGMGIDKSDVRYVLHYNMPQSIENYYQEAGRAGRDGAPADCILFYSAQDMIINEFLIDHKGENSELDFDEIEAVKRNDYLRLNKMRFYCMTKDCLREYMLNYFGEYSHKSDCGNCCNCTLSYEQKDVTAICRDIVSCIAECKQRYGIGVITDILKGSLKPRLQSLGVERLESFGRLKGVNEALIKEAVNHLIIHGYASESEDIYRVIKLNDNVSEILDNDVSISIKWSERKEVSKGSEVKGKSFKKTGNLNSKGLGLFTALRELRITIAREENMPPYIIFSDKTLIDMCKKLPFTKKEMLRVNGVGENKYERYGERFIQCIVDYTDAKKETYYYEDK